MYKKLLLLFTLFSALLGAKELERVSLQLQWFDQFQFAGYYVAKEKGFYRNHGFDVDIIAFKEGINPVEEVTAGRADYGTGRSSLIIDRANGKKVVALAAIFQSSPLVIVAKASSGIKTIEDFKGKTIMVSGTGDSTAVNALLMSKNIDFSTIDFIVGADKMQSLIEGRADIITAYTSNQTHFLEKQGVDITVFDPKEYGFDFYGDMLFTSGSAKDTAGHSAFVRASLKGWKYAFENIDETVELILTKYNRLNKSREELLYEANALKKLAYANAQELGSIDIHKIENIFAVYNTMGLIKESIEIDDFLFDNSPKKIIFTDQEKAYLQQKQRITVCAEPLYYPVEELTEGKHSGIVADILGLLQKQLPVSFEVIPCKTNEENIFNVMQGRCDIKSVVVDGFFPFKNLQASLPYIEDSFAVITKVDKPYIQNMQHYTDKTFVVPYEAFKNYFNREFPQLDIVVAGNPDEALRWLMDDKVYGYIDVSLILNNTVQHHDYKTLKVNTKIENTPVYGAIGVSKSEPLLLDILNRLIQNLPEEEVEKVKEKWSMQTYKAVVDYTLIWWLLLGFSLFFALTLFFMLRQNLLKKKIEEQKDAFETLYQKSTDGILLLENNRFIDCNEAVVTMLGYRTKDEFLNTHPWDLSPTYQPDGRLSSEKSKEMDSIALEQGSNKFEWLHKKADGETFWAEVVLTRLQINGKEILHVVWRDIQRKKELEDEILQVNRDLEHKIAERTAEQNILLSLFDISESVLFKWNNDEHWSVAYVSQSITKLLGYEKDDFLHNRVRYDSCIHPNDIARVKQEVIDAVEQEKEYFTHEPYRLYTKNGDIKWVYDSTMITRDAQGEVVGFVGYTTDITSFKRRDQQLLQQSRLAQMGEMISMIAHQWRQPLAAIAVTSINLKMQLELEKFDLSVPEGRDGYREYLYDALKHIDSYVQNLSTTIDDFRNFYKSNKEYDTVEISYPIKKALSIITASLASRGIDVVDECHCDRQIEMYTNEVMQVILSIIQNAQDNFTEKGTPDAKITLACKESDNGVIIEICDNGGGIEDEIMPAIFDPYFSTKDEKNGTGLGLYMSKMIIEEHHSGSLVATNSNGGVCFTIALNEKLQ